MYGDQNYCLSTLWHAVIESVASTVQWCGRQLLQQLSVTEHTWIHCINPNSTELTPGQSSHHPIG